MPKLTCTPLQLCCDRGTLLQVPIVHGNLATLPGSQTSFYVYHVRLVLFASTSLMLLRRLLLINVSSSRAKGVVSTACHRSS